MPPRYEIAGFHKTAELDDFENGCTGQGSDTYIDSRMHADTLQELQEKIYSFTGCKPEDQKLDACEETGRIDCGVMENADGISPTERELDAWRRGECKLWYCVYTAYVEQVSRIPASLTTN